MVEMEYFSILYEYHATLRRKYEHAASRPWSSVLPDPPVPTHPLHSIL